MLDFEGFIQFYRVKTLDTRGIRTHIVRVEGEHSDHLATALYILRYTVGFAGVGSKPRLDPVKIS